MSRNYGQLGRRSGNSAWQWVVIGAILGFACAATLVLAGLALGFVGINTSGNAVAFGPTQTPVIITATPLPITPTLTPTEVLVTVTPTEAQLAIEAPTATATTDLSKITPTVTNTPNVPPTATRLALGPGNVNSGGQQQIPAALASVASPLLPVSGGTFNMGTTIAEAAQAVNDCTNRDKGQCTAAMAQDSSPQHPVTVAAFQMETYEVSYEQYLTFLNLLGPGSHTNGCDGQPCLATRQESETSNVTFDSANYAVPSVISNRPVVEVTWFGAKAYCEALGRRLPTEAEWERAARGDDGRIYPWGNNWDASRAWTSRSAPDDGEEGGPQPVDSFPTGASPYQVLNMAGNVAEWVSDWYDANYYSSAEAAGPDPQGPPLGDEKVVRGGSWAILPFFARTVHRQSQRPGLPTAEIGFRCAANAANATSSNAANPTPIGADGTLGTANGTPNPATLGQTIPSDEGDSGGSQPTLRPAPTQPPALSQPTALPGPGGATLAPG